MRPPAFRSALTVHRPRPWRRRHRHRLQQESSEETAKPVAAFAVSVVRVQAQDIPRSVLVSGPVSAWEEMQLGRRSQRPARDRAEWWTSASAGAQAVRTPAAAGPPQCWTADLAQGRGGAARSRSRRRLGAFATGARRIAGEGQVHQRDPGGRTARRARAGRCPRRHRAGDARYRRTAPQLRRPARPRRRRHFQAAGAAGPGGRRRQRTAAADPPGPGWSGAPNWPKPNSAGSSPATASS